jgi:hypothetical protein
LRARVAALAGMGVRDPQTLEISGTLDGLALHGTFHSWHTSTDDRFDQVLGAQTERTIRVGEREYVVNTSGDVRELSGSLARRQVTQDFIFSDAFEKEPQYSTWLGQAHLSDGRVVNQLRVAPPGGDVETVSLDLETSMIDQIAYVEGDGIETQTYDEYHVVRGALVADREVDSNGDVQYDQIQHADHTFVNRPIAPAIFTIPESATIQTDAPVTMHVDTLGNRVLVPVTIRGKTFTMLLDTGSQGLVLDAKAAIPLTLVPLGALEIRGATRTGGQGVAELSGVQIGGVTLPTGVVAIVDMTNSTGGTYALDGVLGYPFFAAAEVRIDFVHGTMTFGKPGSLPVLGEKIALDTDRQLPEAPITVDGAPTQALIDTGDGNELLIFQSFLDAHSGLLSSVGAPQTRTYGVGGSINSYDLLVDELDLGPFRLFRRNANVMAVTSGAFADRIDGANVGVPTLRNFIVTFDLANKAMYLKRGADFDDGRDRAQ